MFQRICLFACLIFILTVDLVDSNEFALFYNVYFPENPELALGIVKEQLQYRERSIFPRAPLYYVTIGNDIGELNNCENCKKLRHYINGDETKTLSHLYRYCSKNPNSTVAYLHNKGSFHSNYKQERFRRMLTKSVFSNECLLLQTPQSHTLEESTCKCNICSARFSPIPHLHSSGNMWVSECRYIRKLIHPVVFNISMYQMAISAPVEKFGNVSSIPDHQVPLGRFVSEHWVHSHPDMCPCDVYPDIRYRFGYEPLPINDDWNPKLSRAPRDHVFNKNAVFMVKGQRSREDAWFTFEGLKYQWQFMYRKIPDQDSWVWNYYPNLAGFYLE